MEQYQMGTPTESEGTSQESTETVQGNTPDQGNSPGHNPAWDEVLSVIPEQFHQVITPHFQKWDQAAQSRIESINKQYEQYKPLVEHGIDIDSISQGLQLMHMANNDPKELYNQLQTALGLSAEEAAQVVEEVEGNEEEEEALDPRVAKLQQGFDLLAQRVLEEEQAKENAQFDTEVQKQLDEAKEVLGSSYNEQTERILLAMVHQSLMNEDWDYTISNAAEEFVAMRDGILQSNPRPFAPSVIGSNSGNGVGLPSQQVDVTKLNTTDTRALVAEMARRAAQQR